MPILKVPAAEVLAIKRKGNNKIREYTTGEVLGMTLAGIGLAHLISAPLAGEEAGKLAVLGGVELITGTILGISLEQRLLITHQKCPGIKDNKVKIWTLD